METGSRFTVSSERLEEQRIEPTTLRLRDQHAYPSPRPLLSIDVNTTIFSVIGAGARTCDPDIEVKLHNSVASYNIH